MNKKNCQKQIFISLSPNVEKEDILLVLKILFSPWKWKKGKEIHLVEERFRNRLGLYNVFSCNSGRSALFAILKSLELEKGDEVLIQGFTCNAAVNPILSLGLKPVFVDIDEKTLNISPEEIKKKISSKARVVLIQHTFGLPVEVDKIVEVCDNNNLILIEDCAHSLGAECMGRKIGTFGKASFFSFGRDKIISSVYGGMAATNDLVLAEKLKRIYEGCRYPHIFWIKQQLLHPLLTQLLVKPLYFFLGIGKYALIFLQKSRILSKAVNKKEKKGIMSENFVKKLPNALAMLALNQFKKLDKFNIHREKIAEIYNRNLRNLDIILPCFREGRIYMRYPLIIEKMDTDRILRKLRKKNIFLDDGWRRAVIVPPDTNQDKLGYVSKSCPLAEKIAKNILNLPTHINISNSSAERIIRELISIYKNEEKC